MGYLMAGTAEFDFGLAHTHWLVRKRPVEVEAWQFNGENHAEIVAWIGGGAVAGVRDGDDLNNITALFIETLEGRHRADIGDWIIKGVKGEFYPCKPDIFTATYEPVRRIESTSH